MTPFEKAGYTKDTKFKALTKDGDLNVGDIVTLECDDGSSCPWFENELVDSAIGLLLPNYGNDIEVYEEDSIKKENIGSVVPTPLTITRTNLGTTKIYLSDSIELPSIDSDENGTYVEINNELIVDAYKTLKDSVI